ncbi:shikimate O-hydroxycinnamoyltransferase-like [Selaginella moellendorffii]|uniref:shikimate O-hydroxycinnamoyltransferase-like n=1 Tax=Selaginella moellendorffii TaxID=88036 RepID=UPI000D1C6033|nr:shikimate O-hydroxycinnamoyltransferase-like [Selaginella moellendorffii]|eukprot:XP_024545482.1 shikimate O-hydroxycinnamoyltransferase-like [Selaginella moellendorffii]
MPGFHPGDPGSNAANGIVFDPPHVTGKDVHTFHKGRIISTGCPLAGREDENDIASFLKKPGVGSWTVKPETLTPQPWIHKLSNLDFHISFENYTKQVYYFPPSSRDDLVASLRASLSRVLVPFYVLAGRVRRAEDGHKLEVDCNDGGISFVEAPDASFSDWKNMAFCSIEQHLNPSEVAITDPDTAPIFKVQAGFLISHLILQYFMEFLNLGDEVQVWWDRIRDLNGRSGQAAPILPVRDYYSSPIYNTHSAKATDVTCEYVVKMFEMDPDQVDDLIRDVHSGPYSYGRPPTSFEATSAMMWKAITEARDLQDSIITSYVYAISLKGKNRWNPPVPASYIGNSIHSPCLTAKAKSRHLSYAARLFQEDILSTIQEHMQSAIDWMEMELGRGRKINLNGDFVSVTGIYSTSLHSFPVYSVDFGWGKTVHYSLVMQSWYGNGVTVILPSPRGGRHRRLLISLPAIHMKKLVNHEFFRNYTTLGS